MNPCICVSVHPSIGLLSLQESSVHSSMQEAAAAEEYRRAVDKYNKALKAQSEKILQAKFQEKDGKLNAEAQHFTHRYTYLSLHASVLNLLGPTLRL